jgi:hypothetical protein
MFKNVASQKLTLLAIDTTTNAPKTGDAANLTAYVSKDDGAVTVLGDTSATELDATNAPGLYSFDLTQGETNADKVLGTGKSTTANIKLIPLLVYTLPAAFTSHVAQTGDNFARLGAPAGASVSADIAAIEAQTDDIGAAGAGLTAADDAILAILGAPVGASLSADVAAVKAQTAAIETDTAEIGAAGAGLTNINLPNQTMDIVGSITGNVSGSVGSVTGAVGSVTGAVGSVAAGGLTAASFAANAITAAKLDPDVTTELQSGLATAAAITALDGKVDIIDGNVDDIEALLALTDADVADIKAVTDQWIAAQSEPTGVPAANATPLLKLAILYMMARNQITVTSTKKTYFDDGGAAEFEKDLSDDGTTYTESEVNVP